MNVDCIKFMSFMTAGEEYLVVSRALRSLAVSQLDAGTSIFLRTTTLESTSKFSPLFLFTLQPGTVFEA